MSDSVTYLGITIDSDLRFSDHCVAVATKAKQRLDIVKRFRLLGASDKLCKTLFKSFIESLIFYCMPIMFPSLLSDDKPQFRRLYSVVQKWGICADDFDTVVEERVKRLSLQYHNNGDHFIHTFINRLPSGRLRTFKYRGKVGRDCFLRAMILIVNKELF